MFPNGLYPAAHAQSRLFTTSPFVQVTTENASVTVPPSGNLFVSTPTPPPLGLTLQLLVYSLLHPGTSVQLIILAAQFLFPIAQPSPSLPDPRYPVGQAPHANPLTEFVQLALTAVFYTTKQPPLFEAHSSTSSHLGNPPESHAAWAKLAALQVTWHEESTFDAGSSSQFFL